LGFIKKYTRVLVRCYCGNEFECRLISVKRGDTKSCGCGHLKHGHAINNHPDPVKKNTYVIWSKMKQRCLNPSATHYGNYGGRGIAVCERWLKFENFLADMGLRPSLQHSIERLDVDGNYDPVNCKWAMPAEQAKNRRNVRRIEFNGKAMTIADWAREVGLGERCIWMRLRAGWPLEKILTTPSDRKRPAAPPKPVPA
jgi:hypothetical protein